MGASKVSIVFSIKRTAPKANGYCTVFCRIEFAGKQASFATNLEIPPKYWDEIFMKKNRLNALAKDTASKMELIKARIRTIYWELYERGEVITAELLRDYTTGAVDVDQTLLKRFDQHLQIKKEEVQSGIVKADCLEKWTRCRMVLEQYIRSLHKTDLALREVNTDHIKGFHHYLLTECKYSRNVAIKFMQYFKRVITDAFHAGIMRTNPGANHKMTKEKAKPRFLTEGELLQIIRKKFRNERLEKVRDIFLFSCFTGFSYADVKKLKKSDLKIFFDGKEYFMTDRQKTDNPTHIHLLPVAKMILDKYAEKDTGEYYLPVSSNQKINQYLKEVGDFCGIRMDLTFHMARHTFATLALNKGCSMEVLQEALGHTDSRSTRIYAHILPERSQREFKELAVQTHYYTELYENHTN